MSAFPQERFGQASCRIVGMAPARQRFGTIFLYAGCSRVARGRPGCRGSRLVSLTFSQLGIPTCPDLAPHGTAFPSTVRVPRAYAPALGPEWAEVRLRAEFPSRSSTPRAPLGEVIGTARPKRTRKLALESGTNPSRAEGAKPERLESERTQAELEFERT